MSSIGPLIVIFSFFSAMFAVGKALQKSERKRRRKKRDNLNASAELLKRKLTEEVLRSRQATRDIGLVPSPMGTQNQSSDVPTGLGNLPRGGNA